MNAKKHTPLSLHGLRLLFPPLATLGILFLTEWIARGSLTGETFTQYIFPHAEAYLLAWAMLFLTMSKPICWRGPCCFSAGWQWTG